jgi:hypothetical protein
MRLGAAVVGASGGGHGKWEADVAVYKNKASQKIAVFAYDSTDGSKKTGDAGNITAQISKDGAATAATNDVNPTELDATDAPGIYIFDLEQAETNADMIVLAAVSSTSDIELDPVIIYTEPEQRQADVAAISGDSTAADNLESAYDGTGYDVGGIDVSELNSVVDDLLDGGRLDLIFDDTLADTADLQTNQGNWLTATGYATAAALATVDANVDAILVDTGTTLSGTLTTIESKIDTVDGIVDDILTDTGTTLEGHLTDIKGGTFSGATDSLEAIRNRGDAAWITATGFSTHDAADVRTEMDANSTQLAAIVADTDELQTNQGDWATAVGFSTHAAADVWSVGTRQLTGTQTFNLTGDITGNLSGSVGSVTGSVGALSEAAVTDIWSTYTLPESYAADGSAGTPAQILYLTQQGIIEFAISGTTLTIKQLDGSSTAATCTLDDDTTPTSRTRSG